MKCAGCYKENTGGYCNKCRKKLFDGKQVSTVLPFSAPKNENLRQYHEQAKRLSISGVQLKYSLRLEGKILTLSDGNGQYILKPVPPAPSLAYAEAAPENEHLTMQIAEQVFGIQTAANALVYFEDGLPAYVTRRFDVKADGSKRLQEDMAQLSGKTKSTHGESYKYSGTYEDIGVLIKRYVAAAMPALEIFFRNVLFNYVISNGDAHLKNFSLMQMDAGDYTLTPAYDLMSTILHVPGETDTALDLFEGDINTEYYSTYGHHGYPDFMELAKRLSLVENRAKRIVADMVSKVDAVLAMIDASPLPDELKAAYKHYYIDKVKRITIA
ncbi:MAG: HipA domain-containing protein [Bacteroidota bacterium]